MDLLKQELLNKRKNLSEETGGRKVFNRLEIEQQRIQKRRAEEERDADAKRLCQNQNQNQNPSDPNSSSSPNFKLDSKPKSGDGSTISDEQTLNLPKQEVIRRLRLLKQAVTLFGESDDDRLDRLRYVLQAGLFDLDDNSDMTDGQTNDFQRDIVELKKRDKYGETEDDVIGYGYILLDKRMNTNFCEFCDEDKILVFFNKLLIEWNQELDKMTETEKMTAKGKFKLATFKQCESYLNPLFRFCMKKDLCNDIRQALILVMNCCMKGDYSAASNHYQEIAIGKSAWPIGVTMVGIHERSAREKIHTKSVAHVMNDETTRKYLTSVKRLMSFCESRHPVEFNSLVNDR